MPGERFQAWMSSRLPRRGTGPAGDAVPGSGAAARVREAAGVMVAPGRVAVAPGVAAGLGVAVAPEEKAPKEVLAIMTGR